MPTNTSPNIKTSKSIREPSSVIDKMSPKFDLLIAGQAVVNGLEYLKNRLDWSGTKVAAILHLPSNTVNTWLLKNGTVPINSSVL